MIVRKKFIGCSLLALLGTMICCIGMVPAACITSIAAGPDHTMAIKADGSLWAWGDGFSYQLGYGGNSDRAIPVTISAGYGRMWESVDTGGGYQGSYTVAIKTDGTLWAWGSNYRGQLGDGTTTTSQYPKQITATTGWSIVSAGSWHTMAITDDGSLWGWGTGTLGDGSYGLTSSPMLIGLDTDWESVSAGDNHTMAIKSNGTLWAWGGNMRGQLGDSTTTSSLVPKQITQATDWQSVHAGYNFTIAIKDDGTLWAWGDDAFGQLGIGDVGSSYQTIPVQVGSDENWRKAVVGNSHAVAIKEDGTLWTWGRNYGGQLGDGTTTDRNYPATDITFGVYWETVAAGEEHTIAVKTDGSIYSWGMNEHGQLGDKTWDDKTTLVQIMSYVVTPSVSGNGSISPSTPQTLYCAPESMDFTITPDENNHIYTLGGTCQSRWYSDNGNGTYTFHYSDNTTSNCSVIANFAVNTYSASASVDGGGTLDAHSVNVAHGSTGSFTVTAATGYTTDDTVGGSCPAGSWSGNTYTTGTVIEACNVSFTHTLNNYTVSATVDGGGILDKPSVAVNHGSTGSFTVTAATGYTTDSTVGGSCQAGSWSGNVYTTGPVIEGCNVIFIHTPNSYAVSATVDGGGTLNTPSVDVDHGSTGSFTVTAAVGYTTDNTVGGSCPAGSWSGNTYTTGTVTEACNVSFTHTLNSYTVSASVDGGGILDAPSVSVNHGSTGSFTVTAASGYSTDNAVSGSCPAGSWSGSTYTTGPVTGECSVSFTHTLNSYPVNASVDGNGVLDTPSVVVDHGSNGSFTVTAAANYTTDSMVGGSCPAGSWSGSTYTTGPVTGACNVSFTHTLNSYTVTSSVFGGNGTIDQAGDQIVYHGDTRQFTLNPADGYHSEVVGGSCGGILSGNTFTTNAITSACTVVATFSDQYTLSVIIIGNGSGTVTSAPVGIDGCSADCSADFTQGSSVSLSAVATEPKGKFLGWSGEGCTGTSGCTLIMDQAREISARFKGGFVWNLFFPAILKEAQ